MRAWDAPFIFLLTIDLPCPAVPHKQSQAFQFMYSFATSTHRPKAALSAVMLVHNHKPRPEKPMSTIQTITAYGTVTKTFHWLTALLILTIVPLGVIAKRPPYEANVQLAFKAQLFSFHKTMGVIVLAVALARIFSR
jgi:hypothetical protein